MKLLVEQGVVNVNERDERGATLAHKAAGQGHVAILQWLLEMGASMELTTQSGETPKDVARRFGQLACLKILGGGTDKIEPTVHRQQTESHQRKLSPKEEERARAKQRFEELQKQFDIAKKNFRQLGGQLEEDQKRDTVEQDSQKYVFVVYRSFFSQGLFSRRIEELETQLEFERLKREKRESELDECRTEIGRLVNTLRTFEEKRPHSRVRSHSYVQSIDSKDFSSSNDHRANLVNIEPTKTLPHQPNEHDVWKKKPDLYLFVEILSMLKTISFVPFFELPLQYGISSLIRFYGSPSNWRFEGFLALIEIQ